MFQLIISVAVGPAGEILVAGSCIQVFSAKGDFTEEINTEGKGMCYIFKKIFMSLILKYNLQFRQR
jgi:hypothetical protein